jgi:hypothetical protein
MHSKRRCEDGPEVDHPSCASPITFSDGGGIAGGALGGGLEFTWSRRARGSGRIKADGIAGRASWKGAKMREAASATSSRVRPPAPPRGPDGPEARPRCGLGPWRGRRSVIVLRGAGDHGYPPLAGHRPHPRSHRGAGSQAGRGKGQDPFRHRLPEQRWFVSFTVEIDRDLPDRYPRPETAVGVDVGLKALGGRPGSSWRPGPPPGAPGLM